MSTPITRLEDIDILVREDAADQEWHDAEYDAWLEAWLSEVYEAWLDDVEPDVEPVVDELVTEWAAADYVPFQLGASHYADCRGTLFDAPGYAESVTPFYF